MNLSDFYNLGYSAGLEKLAAPAWVEAFKAGKLTLDQVKKIMSAQRGAKVVDRGRGVRKVRGSKEVLRPRGTTGTRDLGEELGWGGEGVARLFSHKGSASGLAAAKFNDPRTIFYSPEVMASKVRSWKLLNKARHPDAARYLGRQKGAPVTYHEYIPKGMAVADDQAAHVGKSINTYLRGKGMAPLGDMHGGNFMMTPSGPKMVDFLPGSPHTMRNTGLAISKDSSKLMSKYPYNSIDAAVGKQMMGRGYAPRNTPGASAERVKRTFTSRPVPPRPLDLNQVQTDITKGMGASQGNLANMSRTQPITQAVTQSVTTPVSGSAPSLKLWKPNNPLNKRFINAGPRAGVGR